MTALSSVEAPQLSLTLFAVTFEDDRVPGVVGGVVSELGGVAQLRSGASRLDAPFAVADVTLMTSEPATSGP
ncbi:hypothetical protein [Streptomyces sp. NPDC002520]